MTGETPQRARLRVGIDLGGTKIAGVALGPAGRSLGEHRAPSPRHDYWATIRAIADMVRLLEQRAGAEGSIGVGIPGSVAPASRLVQNANSTWLNGKPFQHDLEAHLGRPVRLANDANCFALSEAVDGAGAGARSVFGVILGTGCGGGLVREGPHRRAARNWRRMGPQPAALGECRRASRSPLLVRPCRMHRDVGFWTRPGEGSCARDGRADLRRGGRRQSAQRRRQCPSNARAPRAPPRSWAGARHQYLRSGRDRAGGRPLQANPPLRCAPEADGPPRVRCARARRDQATGLGRCRRSARRRVAVGLVAKLARVLLRDAPSAVGEGALGERPQRKSAGSATTPTHGSSGAPERPAGSALRWWQRGAR